MILSPVSFALGALGWSASEYCIHRYVGHGPRRKRKDSLLARITPAGLAAEFNEEHLAHHADPTYFAATSRKVLAAAAGIPMVGGALLPFVGARHAASFALGFGIAYGAYEVLHRRIHTHPPKGRYGRWARKHHLLHHHRTPRSNHGVTSPLWDLLTRTALPHDKVKIPRHVAPVWLADERGEVKPELRDDYELVGKARPAPSASVHAAAAPA